MIVKCIQQISFFFSFYACFLFVKFIGLFVVKSPKKNNRKVLYLSPYYPENASHIYRLQKWAEILNKEGYEADVKYTLSRDQFNGYLKTNDVRFYLITLFRRTWQVLTSYKYDMVIVSRELLVYNDYGNLFLEKFLLKIHPDAILDFDDASSYEKGEPREITTLFGKLMLENGSRFLTSLTLYKKYIPAGDYLRDYLKNINNRVSDNSICVMPMVVDYEIYPPKKYDDLCGRPIALGWLGSTSNLPSLEEIIPAINELHKIIPVKLIVVSGMEFKQDVDFEIENIQWTYETQIESMLKMDVGLMPLKDTFKTVGSSGSVITKGKGGFKLLQYMGLGIVSVADDTIIERMRISETFDLIDDNIDGFLVKSGETWLEVLKKALESKNQFDQIGKLARRKIQQNYSYVSHKEEYITFINKDMS